MKRYQAPGGMRYHFRNAFTYLGMVAVCICLSGCSTFAERYFQRSVDPAGGELQLSGLKEAVTVRRDAYGIPYVEARNVQDLAMAIGYVNASDRLTQMTGFKLLSQGRIAEMAGPSALNLDMYMRAMNLRRAAENLARHTSPENMALLESYAAGVNAYITAHRNRLPPGLALAGYSPEAWTPTDSLMLFSLVSFALSFNLHEEIAALAVAQKVGAEKTVWLLPIYPDEPLPFAEAAKLQGLDLQRKGANLAGYANWQPVLRALGLGGLAASNNWVIGKNKTRGQASILANDQHLALSMPAMYNLMHVRCNNLDVAGVNLAGLPSIVAGYNGQIAWGMTMVMADNQDIFLEQLRIIRGEMHYLYKGQWVPARKREEIFRIKDQAPVTFNIYETVHGPLLNEILSKEPTHIIRAKQIDLPYGIALSYAPTADVDESVNAFFGLNQAGSLEEAGALIRRIRAIPLNMVAADRENISWQVTGNYPVRAGGRGLMPSPGWTGAYDWRGLLNPDALPGIKNPASGFIGTANHRTIGRDYPHVLSSSWYWPERAERIAQMISATDQHTFQTSMDMQLDVRSPFIPKLQAFLLQGEPAVAIDKEIQSWPDAEKRAKARMALAMLKDFDGNMKPESEGAALVSAFLDQATKNIFLDELGPADSASWHAFAVLNTESYNATCDHLLVRGDESPFWDNIQTPAKETKAMILAQSLADAVVFLEKALGFESRLWRWGLLHTYLWETDSYKMAPHLGFFERTALGAMTSYFNRGPYPAPGDFFTLNVSMYTMGKDFETWIIPGMRLIVDFSREEPMMAVNSSGQSDNPSSPHYADGITLWREGRYIPFPFRDAAVKAQYQDVLILRP
ncbi:MAG TPA: penicillin acylase family protein [Smithellaceae bacterium]|nr:penicillin acylase family protein [Smithellaceae bacterium]